MVQRYVGTSARPQPPVVVIATAVETKHAGHQSMSEAQGNWGGV